MTRLFLALALASVACAPGEGTCPVVALAGATPHSVNGEVVTALLAADPIGRRVCITEFRHRSYADLGEPAAEVTMA